MDIYKKKYQIVITQSETMEPKIIEETTKNAIRMIGGLNRLIERGDKVLIKPNFVAPIPHAVTNLSIIKCVVQEVLECGGEPIIGESSGFEFDTEEVFEIIGIKEVARRFGVKLVNLDKEKFIKLKVKNFPIYEMLVPKILMDIPKIINVPKLKSHKQTTVSLGMKNLMGLIHRDSRRKLHILGLNRSIIMLEQIFHPILNIVDGLLVPTNGAVYSKFKEFKIIVMGENTLAVDNICCEILGIPPIAVSYISYANKIKGFDISQVRIVGDYNQNKSQLLKENVTKYAKFFNNRLVYKVFTKGMYVFDYFYSKLFQHSSIPYFNLKFGVKPKVVKPTCENIEECIKSCPVGAISGPPLKIDYKKCMYVRCFHCIDKCSGSIIADG